jgi:hypothetical protein
MLPKYSPLVARLPKYSPLVAELPKYSPFVFGYFVQPHFFKVSAAPVTNPSTELALAEGALVVRALAAGPGTLTFGYMGAFKKINMAVAHNYASLNNVPLVWKHSNMYTYISPKQMLYT